MKLLTTRQASELLGLSVYHLARLRCEGGGPRFVKLGHSSVRYRAADLESWVESRVRQNTTGEGEAA